MKEFEDDDYIDLNAPLDFRFVILGLSLLILSLVLIASAKSIWTIYFGAIAFFASFFVMTKKDKQNNYQ
jgi:hypothetical protein